MTPVSGNPEAAKASTAPLHVLAVLSALMGFASISTDFYLPALPAMAEAFHAAPGTLEFTITGYLIGFSLGQLVWGPISDRFGRRIPVALGLSLFVIGSVGCALSGDTSSIISWRVVQAAGGSAGVVLARAMVRDLYQGHRAAQMLSTLIAVMAVAPLIGPIMGGWITGLAGWRAIFWSLAVIGVVTFAALFSIPETLPPDARRRESLVDAFMRYGDLLRRPKILGYIGVGGFFYAAMYAYIAASPFAFISYYHVPADRYGFLFGAGILGIVGSNLVNTRLLIRFGTSRIMTVAAFAAVMAALLLALTAFTGFGGLWGLFIPLLMFVSCTGFIVANSIAGALADFPTEAGAVSALVGALQYGAGIISSALVGILADGTPWPMGLTIALCAIGSLMCTRLIRQPGQAEGAREPT